MSTVLLPEKFARILIDHVRTGKPLFGATADVRYAHYIAAHEQGHSVDNHYRFTGQQTKLSIVPGAPLRLEQLWRPMASKLLSELCAEGYASTTISPETHAERVTVQNQMSARYWQELEKDFAANPGGEQLVGRSMAAAVFVLQVMQCHMHAVAAHIANPALPKPVALWSPPRKDLAEPRGFMTNWLRQAWDQRQEIRAVDFEQKAMESGQRIAKKLGFEVKVASGDDQSDWLVGPAGGFR